MVTQLTKHYLALIIVIYTVGISPCAYHIQYSLCCIPLARRILALLSHHRTGETKNKYSICVSTCTPLTCHGTITRAGSDRGEERVPIYRKTFACVGKDYTNHTHSLMVRRRPFCEVSCLVGLAFGVRACEHFSVYPVTPPHSDRKYTLPHTLHKETASVIAPLKRRREGGQGH